MTPRPIPRASLASMAARRKAPPSLATHLAVWVWKDGRQVTERISFSDLRGE